MSATDSVMYSLERNWEMVQAAISGLDEKALMQVCSRLKACGGKITRLSKSVAISDDI